jgi:hypothetical protein
MWELTAPSLLIVLRVWLGVGESELLLFALLVGLGGLGGG